MGKDRLAAFRWCDRDYHHDYGAGVKGAARFGLDGANGSDSKFRELCFELYLFGDLLEQSKSKSAQLGNHGPQEFTRRHAQSRRLL